MTTAKPVAARPEALRQLAYSDPEHFPVLLDSAAVGALGGYSILGAYPRGALWQDGAGRLHASGPVLAGEGGFLSALDRNWRALRSGPTGANEPTDCGAATGARSLPFRGGWMVFLGYELATEIEPRLNLRVPISADESAPVAFALRIPAGLIYDHMNGRMWLFAEPGEAWAEGLEGALAALATSPPAPSSQRAASPAIEEEEPTRFRSRVEAALDYIRAGDIYQANLSRPWRGRLGGDATAPTVAAQMYERLRSVNPAPFGALAQFQGWRLLSSSPERLVRVQGTHVETRPIAGTRPRSGIDDRHAREIAGLIEHPKERAEHVMLIDLERNDLGRICRPGSVRADEFMAIESYAHVHHIVSNVSGQLREPAAPIEVLKAVFPGGTITGCPKFRCMQIIAELEGEPRQAYTGALGYLNHDGSMDFNILIRSLTLHQQRIEFRTGAGIVADSHWQRELAETRAKARGVLLGLRVGA
jgi:anthranilate synthase component 1